MDAYSDSDADADADAGGVVQELFLDFEMPQSQSTAFQRHQKKETRGTNNDKTNVI